MVLETHGGEGWLYRACYADCARGVVFETDEKKAAVLAGQRPTWAVYQGDCVRALRNGIGNHLSVDLLDLDPYGEPWPALEAFFAAHRQWPDRMGVVVNDGLRQKLKMNGAWTVESMHRAVAKWGNDAMHDHYLEVCREEVSYLCAPAGYQIARWTGYYCGHAQQMTHYAAVLTRTGAG